MIIEMYMIPVNKKTGKAHCPICYNKLRATEIESVLHCTKCKKYFQNPKSNCYKNKTKENKDE